MTTDFGGGRRRKGPNVLLIIIAAIVLLAAAAGGIWYLRLAGNVRTAQAWAISGPPCPQASAQAFAAQPVKIHDRFDLNDITFGRGGGHVSCQNIVNDGGRGFGTFTECQFTGPGAIEVTTKSGDVYFLTRGDPATVSVKKDAVSCVLAGNFKGEQSVPGE